MAKVKRYRFAKKVYAKRGKISTALAVVCLGLLLAASIISFAMRGNAGVFVGGIAFMAMLLSIYGFYLGMRGFSEKDCSNLFCIIGAIANGLLMVSFLGIYLAGV